MTAVKTRKTINMTEGPLLLKILLFVVPLMVTNLLQVAYNAADMIVVGLSSEPDAVGAIGITGAFINLVINVFFGFATGTNVMTARYLGSKEDWRVQRVVHTSILMAVIFGAISGIIGLFISRPVLALIGAEGKLLDLATKYTVIYFAGVPFISLTNYLIAIFRAKGDTKTPLYVLAASGLINVGLNLLFVLGFGRSVDGVAYATVISNAVSAIVLLYILAKDEGPCRFSFKNLKINKHAFAAIVKIGLPAGLQGSLFAISNMLIQSSLLQLNNAVCSVESEFQPVVKGNAAVSNLEGFVYTATNSVHQASITFTSQNTGAAKYNRVKRVMGCCYLLTFLIAELFGGALILFREPLMGLYGIHPGEEGTLMRIAFETGCTRIFVTIIPYCTLAFMEVGSGVVRGLGKSLTSTVVSLVGSCLLRIVWIETIFRANPTTFVLYICYPISWTLTAVFHLTCALLVLRHYIKTQREYNVHANA